MSKIFRNCYQSVEERIAKGNILLKVYEADDITAAHV